MFSLLYCSDWLSGMVASCEVSPPHTAPARYWIVPVAYVFASEETPDVSWAIRSCQDIAQGIIAYPAARWDGGRYFER